MSKIESVSAKLYTLHAKATVRKRLNEQIEAEKDEIYHAAAMKEAMDSINAQIDSPGLAPEAHVPSNPYVLEKLVEAGFIIDHKAGDGGPKVRW